MDFKREAYSWLQGTHIYSARLVSTRFATSRRHTRHHPYFHRHRRYARHRPHYQHRRRRPHHQRHLLYHRHRRGTNKTKWMLSLELFYPLKSSRVERNYLPVATRRITERFSIHSPAIADDEYNPIQIAAHSSIDARTPASAHPLPRDTTPT